MPKKVEPTESETKAAEKALAESSAEHESPAVEDPHDDRTREVTHLSFTRMRTDWHGPDASVMHKIQMQVDNQILINFGDAYKILHDIYEVVREHVLDGEGEIVRDETGWPTYVRSESGRFIEDYSKLGIKQREEFLFQITTRLVDWEQQSADAWGEAMFAKGVWEERFTEAFFETPDGGRKTDEAMTQRGRLGSRDERYFALYKSYYSRKAEALMRSMALLAQRLKDALYQ